MVRPSFIRELEEKEMTIKDWIEEIICYNQPVIFFRKIGRFIIRLIRWLPVLYKQEEWDFGYIYPILELKIKELRKSISKDTWHVKEEVEKELEQIDEVLDYLDKYRHWEKYIEIPFISNSFELQENGNYKLNLTEEQHKLYQKANEIEEYNFNKFWDKLKEYHTNWWT